MRTVLVALMAAFAAGGETTDLIDRRIAERWETERVKPAPPAGDHEFLRRLSIDVRGVIPTSAEVRAFVGDADPRKRGKIVDAWLAGGEFATHWAFRTAEQLGMSPMYADRVHDYHDDFRRWLREALRSNMPYDRMVRRIVTSNGPTDLDPAAVFMMGTLIVSPDGAKDVTERLARVFLGAQIRCAECHDHPFDTWTQQDFHAMTSFFSATKADGRKKEMGGFNGWLEDDPKGPESSYAAPGGDAGKKNFKSHPPRFKSGEGPQAGEPRRAAFARLLLADRQFARAAVNRHWGMLLGRGFVQPLDGFAAGRKASHPELLEQLTDEFIRSKYDVRALLKSILLSKAYQVSSRGDGGREAEVIFARAAPASLTPEQLFDSVLRATGIEDRPLETSSKLGPVSLRQAFLREFRPANLAPNATAPAAPSIGQALFMLNGELSALAASAEGKTLLAAILAARREPELRIEELFISTLSRPPKPSERDGLLQRVRKAGDTPRVYEDILWALINTTEFATRR